MTARRLCLIPALLLALAACGGARSGTATRAPETPDEAICRQEAAQMPRSVTSPVTRRAGVTSKAKLRAGLAAGRIATRVRSPVSERPATKRSSLSARSSIGICATPSERLQSIVDDGSAT